MFDSDEYSEIEDDESEHTSSVRSHTDCVLGRTEEGK